MDTTMGTFLSPRVPSGHAQTPTGGTPDLRPWDRRSLGAKVCAYRKTQTGLGG
jgi:hypothetical protein